MYVGHTRVLEGIEKALSVGVPTVKVMCMLS